MHGTLGSRLQRLSAPRGWHLYYSWFYAALTRPGSKGPNKARIGSAGRHLRHFRGTRMKLQPLQANTTAALAGTSKRQGSMQRTLASEGDLPTWRSRRRPVASPPPYLRPLPLHDGNASIISVLQILLSWCTASYQAIARDKAYCRHDAVVYGARVWCTGFFWGGSDDHV